MLTCDIRRRFFRPYLRPGRDRFFDGVMNYLHEEWLLKWRGIQLNGISPKGIQYLENLRKNMHLFHIVRSIDEAKELVK